MSNPTEGKTKNIILQFKFTKIMKMGVSGTLFIPKVMRIFKIIVLPTMFLIKF